jgi:hypothetical protein
VKGSMPFRCCESTRPGAMVWRMLGCRLLLGLGAAGLLAGAAASSLTAQAPTAQAPAAPVPAAPVPSAAPIPAVTRGPDRAAVVPPALRTDLSLRPGYHGSWRTDRDGATSQREDLRARVQLGGWWAPGAAWAVRARLAGRLSTDQDDLRFYVRDHLPATDGIRQGDATIDEAYVRWQPDDRLQLRVGRLQTSFELAGVPRKSLDRNDSPNTDVTWTDGVHASIRLGGGVRQHIVLQHNSRSGPTNVVRAPLDFSGPGSRVTVFTSLHLEGRWGPFIQREADITFIPGVIPGVVPGADPDGDGGDYIAAVLRLALQPPTSPLGGRLLLGTELGVATATPSRALLGTGTAADGRGDGRAMQLSASIMDMGGRHSVGVVHSRAGDGWLISPDIRDNNRELEARYYHQYASWGRLDVRFRHREDLYRRVAAPQRRVDRDIYIRTTLRF